MTVPKITEREALVRRLECERKKLNEAIVQGISTQECLACSRRVDALLEQLLELDMACGKKNVCSIDFSMKS